MVLILHNKEAIYTENSGMQISKRYNELYIIIIIVGPCYKQKLALHF